MKVNKVDEWNENFRNWNGFDIKGNTWIVLGDTFDIKDEIKSKGGKFCRELGWHFDHDEPGYQLFKINMQDVTDTYEDGRLYFSENTWEIVKEIKEKFTRYEPSTSMWIGEKGDKVTFEGTLNNYRSYYGNFGETGIFEFKDKFGNMIVWMTSPDRDIDYDHIYQIEGTIKDLNEYKGVKYTRVTRCKIRDERKK